jgi:hypothetical protein
MKIKLFLPQGMVREIILWTVLVGMLIGSSLFLPFQITMFIAGICILTCVVNIFKLRTVKDNTTYIYAGTSKSGYVFLKERLGLRIHLRASFLFGVFSSMKALTSLSSYNATNYHAAFFPRINLESENVIADNYYPTKDEINELADETLIFRGATRAKRYRAKCLNTIEVGQKVRKALLGKTTCILPTQ